MNPVTKEEVISLLTELNVSNIGALTDPEITAESIIGYLAKYRIFVPDIFFSSLADRLGLEYIEKEAIAKTLDLGCILPFTVEEGALILLLESKPVYVRVATANPLDTDLFKRLEEVFHKKIERVVVSIETVRSMSEGCYEAPHAYSALNELVDRQPDESAYRILIPWQKGVIAILLFLMALLIAYNPYFGTFLIFTVINITYFLMNPVKFYISLQGLSGTKRVIFITDDDIKAIRDEDLPIYTLLVPLFHEKEMLPHILSNIAKMDYPREKLDVKILMEEEDEETIGKARKLGLFGNIEEIITPMTEDEYRKFLSIFHPVIIPNAELKTKPRACNYGLKRARGEFVVIYDAEDLPDRDQLKKTVLAFRRLGSEYACIQCLLNFYNPRKNVLTRWFSIEYSYYYDYYIQGLDKIGAPIPLGGTSNHFRMRTLRELGAWDPFNVTEDADLGMRIARKKYKTGVLNSHTYEEAVTSIRSWIKQRSRWVKGFVITWFVTMRHPIKVYKDIGLKNFLVFQTGFGGNFYLPLMNLFLWGVFVAGFIIPEYFSHWFDFWPFAAIAVFNLIIGNLFFLVMMLLATWKEKQKDLLIYSLFSPIYWIFMSIGAWKGLIQLAAGKAYKWEKTAHGTSLLTEEKIRQEPENLARQVRWIEVKEPEVRNGKTHMTVPQLAFSIGFTICLVLFALIIVDIVPFAPVSDHIKITTVPGLSQALSPLEKMKAGEEPRLLNYEAIPKPNEAAPHVTLIPSGEPGVMLRQKQEIRSNQEPGLTLVYDPETNLIQIRAEGSDHNTSDTTRAYEVMITSSEGVSLYRIDSTPATLTISGGNTSAEIQINRTYESGARVLALEGTI
ncbi:glycosyltransferase family 2 protein [uncultured Methanospirillum sp.]|uniref:glycosyltransferase family 2 protein n=1 Tax=uncultured Methanospirillum sp. TaxID=262503 RepID=UPI0029C632F5|nr:glycosyltransferase family 2 protein [uncultured Methanospirillum sp.]